MQRCVLVVLLNVCILSLLGYDKISFAQSATSSKKEINIANLKVIPVSSNDCEVEISFSAKYQNFRTGKEPKMWWQFYDKNKKLLTVGFMPLKNIKEGKSSIRITSERVGLNTMASCSGSNKVFIFIEDGSIQSKRVEAALSFDK